MSGIQWFLGGSLLVFCAPGTGCCSFPQILQALIKSLRTAHSRLTNCTRSTFLRDLLRTLLASCPGETSWWCHKVDTSRPLWGPLCRACGRAQFWKLCPAWAYSCPLQDNAETLIPFQRCPNSGMLGSWPHVSSWFCGCRPLAVLLPS